MTQLELRREERDGRVWIAPVGELDLAALPLLEPELGDRGTGAAPVVLDLRGVEFLDSSGIRLLLRARAEATADGWELIIVRPQAPAVRRTLELVGAVELLAFVDADELSDPGTARSG